MNEFIPVKYQNITTTWFPAGDAFVLIYQSIFYLLLPNWYYVHSVAILFAIVLLYFNYYLPESPKYMYANRRYSETRQILKVVAKKNRAKITSLEIDAIIFEFETKDESENKEINNY